MTIPAVNSGRPPAGSPGSPASRWPARVGADLLRPVVANFLEERERWFLWLPVALGIGIAVYFSLETEPPRWPVGIWVALLGAACWWCRRRPALLLPAVAALAVGIGFGAAQLRTAAIEGPLLQERTRPGLVRGRVAEVEPAGRGWRIVLQDLEIERLDSGATPRKVRIALQRRDTAPEPGATISVRAVLMPLPKPAMPDAFDFARHAFFQGLGGLGYALSTVSVEQAPGRPGSLAEAAGMARRTVAGRIGAALDDGRQSGLTRKSLAEALIVGQRGAIPEDIAQAMRDSGLAHLLAISGLHVGLVAGFVFFVVRAGLALVPPVALRWPIRKWAAGVALVAAFGYLLLSGATIPTQRAFLMLAIALVAIVADRFQINMRPVAWAAVAILLVMPESLVGASFQLSFAAVAGLVAAYESVRARWRNIGVGAGLARDPTRARASALGLYFLAVTFTSLIATLATAPFAIANFNRVALYGIAANLVAVPMTAFWIMPSGIIALALMPLGAEEPALLVMAWGIDAVTWVAARVAAWPGAVLLVPALPTYAGILIAAGGLWLVIWRRRWRLLGLPAIALGLASATWTDRPDLIVSGDGGLVAVRDESNALHASSLTREKFVRGVWMQRLASIQASAWPATGGETERPLTCDAVGCVFRKDATVVGLPWNERALLDDCAASDAVVAIVPAGRGICPGLAVLIDRFDLWRNGAHAVWIDRGRISYRTAREGQGMRPWTNWPQRTPSAMPDSESLDPAQSDPTR